MAKDLRIVKTQKAIESSLLDLIEEKGFQNVRMKELAERAQVNRNTIYLHYTSKEDIIQKMIDRLFINQIAQVDVEEMTKSQFNKKKTIVAFEKLFNILGEEIELYRTLLTEPSLTGYLDKIINNIRLIMLANIKHTTKNEIGIEFILSGIYGVLKKWIVYDLGTAKENAEMLSDLVLITYRRLQLI